MSLSGLLDLISFWLWRHLEDISETASKVENLIAVTKGELSIVIVTFLWILFDNVHKKSAWPGLAAFPTTLGNNMDQGAAILAKKFFMGKFLN